MTQTLRARIGGAIRRERQNQQLSVSELARRASIAKATVSQLESGAGNPSVETLWAIAVALGVPFSAFVEQTASSSRLIRAGRSLPTDVSSSDANYQAGLLSASPPGARRDLFIIRAEPGTAKHSEPHQPGTIEHVIVQSGRARAGTVTDPVDLGPGDYLSYPADVPHVFDALETGTSAVMLVDQR